MTRRSHLNDRRFFCLGLFSDSLSPISDLNKYPDFERKERAREGWVKNEERGDKIRGETETEIEIEKETETET